MSAAAFVMIRCDQSGALCMQPLLVRTLAMMWDAAAFNVAECMGWVGCGFAVGSVGMKSGA